MDIFNMCKQFNPFKSLTKLAKESLFSAFKLISPSKDHNLIFWFILNLASWILFFLDKKFTNLALLKNCGSLNISTRWMLEREMDVFASIFPMMWFPSEFIVPHRL